MTTFPGSPRLVKGGIVSIDPKSSAVQRVIPLQYNPETLMRTLQVQSIEGEGGDRSTSLRLTRSPVETISIETVIDATDMLEFPKEHSTTTLHGIHPQLAALEMLVYPASSQLVANNNLAQAGTLEIIPMEAPLTLFVWSKNRIVPVRLTEFSITEEAFDPALNPIWAKVSLGMRVLSVDDLGFLHKGGSLFMAYLRQKESLRSLSQGSALSALGIGGIS